MEARLDAAIARIAALEARPCPCHEHEHPDLQACHRQLTAGWSKCIAADPACAAEASVAIATGADVAAAVYSHGFAVCPVSDCHCPLRLSIPA